MLIFHYTCSKSDLRRTKMLIFQYTYSKKMFRGGENVNISVYVYSKSDLWRVNMSIYVNISVYIEQKDVPGG